MYLLNSFLLTIVVLSSIGASQAKLIAHWDFDESSGGTAADSVGAIDAVWQNGTGSNLAWTSGQIGGAADLGGQTAGNNYFSIGTLGTLSGATGMTLSVWINPDGFTGSTYEGIFTTRATLTGTAAGNQNWGFSWEDGNASNGEPHLDSRTGNGVDSNPASILAGGGWRHIALVWDGLLGTHVQYINGVRSAGGSGPVGNLTGGVWHIGHDDCCGGNRDFDGKIDDLGVWDNALSDADILAIYNNGLAGNPLDETPPGSSTDPLDVGLVINEVHYDAEPKTEFVESIELLNTNRTPLDLGGWVLADGIASTIPAGTTLGAAEYPDPSGEPRRANIENSPTSLQERRIFQYAGSLSNDGERIELRDAAGAVADSVTYRAEFPWPIAPNGEGDSMQLINAQPRQRSRWRLACRPCPRRASQTSSLQAMPRR